MLAKKQEFAGKGKEKKKAQHNKTETNRTEPHPKEEREQQNKKRRRWWHNGFPTPGFHHLGYEILSAFPSKNQHGGRRWLRTAWVWQGWRAQHHPHPSAVDQGPQGKDLTHYCSPQTKRSKIDTSSGRFRCHRALDSGACCYLLIYQTSQSI